ncbi:hypothetical protein V2J09_023836 [Rumex salicifolius]
MVNPSRPRVSVSSLLCQETGTSCFDGEHDDPFVIRLMNSDGFCSELEEDYVHLMLQKEKLCFSSSSSSSSSSSKSTGNWTNTARLNAVNYILNAREIWGFELQTAYLSVTYLDRFLSQRAWDNEKPWAMQLLTVGCLSLATKMQESNPLNFASFHDGGFKFDLKSIQRMELLILCTLDWKMGSIIPFAFLQYFVNILFVKPPSWSTLTRILELIVAIVKDVNLMDHYPSAIALAAVLMSLDQRLTKNTLELKINSLPCSKCLDIEDVYNCYIIMQHSEKDKLRIPKLASPELSPRSTKRMLGFRSSPSTSSIVSKRKRLTFDDT